MYPSYYFGFNLGTKVLAWDVNLNAMKYPYPTGVGKSDILIIDT